MSSAYRAYLLWVWAILVYLNSLPDGFMRQVHYVYIFSVIAILRIFIDAQTYSDRVHWHKGALLLLLFLLQGLVSCFFAAEGSLQHWKIFEDLVKCCVPCLLMPAVINSKERLFVLFAVISLGLSLFPLIDGIKFLLSAGAHPSVGGKFGDNNHTAVVYAMTVPLLFFFAVNSKSSVLKVVSYMGLVFSNLAVLSTQSRGGLISLIAAWAGIVLIGRLKVRGMLVALLLAFVISMSLTDQLRSRYSTIQNADEDISFSGRLTAWKRASAIALDNPFFGVGFDAAQTWGVFQRYRYDQGFLWFLETPDVNYPAAAHSIFFQVLGDLGFLGLFFFGLIIYCTIRNLYQVSRDCALADEPAFAGMSQACLVSVLVFLVGGSAVSLAYLPLVYFIFSFSFVLRSVCLRQFAETYAYRVRPK